MKALLGITTANYYTYTKMCLQSFLPQKPNWLDVVVVDDASDDPTREIVEGMGVPFFGKPRPLGLTDSWNRISRLFADGDYDWVFFSNNDVLIPVVALDALRATAEEVGPCILGPLSTRKGVGHVPAQSLSRVWGKAILEGLDPFANYETIQDRVTLQQGDDYESWGKEAVLNGFFFGAHRVALKFAVDGQLFDPCNVNTKNEDEFCRKVSLAKVLCRRAYIAHFKGISFSTYAASRASRESTWDTIRESRRSHGTR